MDSNGLTTVYGVYDALQHGKLIKTYEKKKWAEKFMMKSIYYYMRERKVIKFTLC